MDPLVMNFSSKKWSIADLITKNRRFLLIKSSGPLFWGGKPVLQIEASLVCLWRIMFSFWNLSIYSWNVPIYSWNIPICSWNIPNGEGQTTSTPNGLGPQPNSRTQEKINAWAYPHCRLINNFTRWTPTFNITLIQNIGNIYIWNI